MSDVSKTNELIAEAREHTEQPGSPNINDGQGYCGRCSRNWPCVTSQLAAALEAATRVPVQGEPNADRESPRVSMEVIREYRHILAWLEEQSALRAPTGDTMHGLAAEALSVLIEHEYSRHEIPLYGMLDVWKALYETSHPEWDEFYEKHGYAETWARLLDEVRSRSTVPDAATAAIAAVRAIHYDAGMSQGYGAQFKGGYGEIENCCAACGSFGEFGVAYPCPTIAALDGAPEPDGIARAVVEAIGGEGA